MTLERASAEAYTELCRDLGIDDDTVWAYSQPIALALMDGPCWLFSTDLPEPDIGQTRCSATLHLQHQQNRIGAFLTDITMDGVPCRVGLSLARHLRPADKPEASSHGVYVPHAALERPSFLAAVSAEGAGIVPVGPRFLPAMGGLYDARLMILSALDRVADQDPEVRTGLALPLAARYVLPQQVGSPDEA